MSTQGWEDVTEADIRRMGRQGSKSAIRGDVARSDASCKGQGTPAESKPQKRSKYRAIACIVTEDLTLFTLEDISRVEQARVAGVIGTFAERAKAHGIDGLWFGSTKEANRWIELRRLELAGMIRELRRQVPFSLDVNGTTIGKWIADFVYEELSEVETEPRIWHTVREDSKGVRTPVYRRSKAHIEAQYGFSIRET